MTQDQALTGAKCHHSQVSLRRTDEDPKTTTTKLSQQSEPLPTNQQVAQPPVGLLPLSRSRVSREGCKLLRAADEQSARSSARQQLQPNFAFSPFHGSLPLGGAGERQTAGSPRPAALLGAPVLCPSLPAGCREPFAFGRSSTMAEEAAAAPEEPREGARGRQQLPGTGANKSQILILNNLKMKS